MKRAAIVLLSIGLAYSVFAELPMDPEMADEIEDDAMLGESVAEFVEQPPPSPQPDSPVFHWLEHLRHRNPELVERLERLYRENPRMFHMRVRNLMEQQRVRFVLKRYPAVAAAVSNLPPQERAAFYREMAGPGLCPPHRGGPRHALMEPGDPTEMFHHRSKEWAAPDALSGRIMPRLREMREQYQRAQTPEQREQIIAELRRQFEEISNDRQRRRMERLERIEAEIARMKQELEALQRRREEMFQTQLEVWLSETNSLDAPEESQPIF